MENKEWRARGERKNILAQGCSCGEKESRILSRERGKFTKCLMIREKIVKKYRVRKVE